MQPLNWSRIDTDQSEIVDTRSFVLRRGLFVIEEPPINAAE